LGEVFVQVVVFVWKKGKKMLRLVLIFFFLVMDGQKKKVTPKFDHRTND